MNGWSAIEVKADVTSGSMPPMLTSCLFQRKQSGVTSREAVEDREAYLYSHAYSATGFESKMACFCVFWLVNYRSWQAEILQERAEGCIQVDLQKKIRQT